MTAVLTEVELGDQVAVRGAPQPGFPLEPNTTAAARDRLVLRRTTTKREEQSLYGQYSDSQRHSR